jgi:hypothetical protein
MPNKKNEIYKLNRARLDNYDKHYVIYSDKLSSACRQLAFSEGAVFWIFNEASYLSIWIAIRLLFLVLFFCVDIFQYYFGMHDYEESATKMRTKMAHQKYENDYQEISSEENDPNKRLEQCFKWKIVFIGVSSVLLAIVFFKIFLIC